MKHQLAKRFILCFVGVAIMSFGIALSTKSALGTPPISSVPFTLTFFTDLSLGGWTLVLNVIFIGLQALILRKNFRPFQLLQFPLTLVFSVVIDLALVCFSWVDPTFYPLRLLVLVLGLFLLAFGVSVEVLTNTLTVPGDGIVKALTWMSKKPFGNVKLAFDICLVVIAILISLAHSGTIQGVREGTVIAAACVGPLTRLIMPRLKKHFAIFRNTGMDDIKT